MIKVNESYSPQQVLELSKKVQDELSKNGISYRTKGKTQSMIVVPKQYLDKATRIKNELISDPLVISVMSQA